MWCTPDKLPTALPWIWFLTCQTFGGKLGSAACTFQQKASLVSRVAWPRALHAVSAAVVGKRHFESLRTSVMQSLGGFWC